MGKISRRWPYYAGDFGGKNQDACGTFRIQKFVFKLTSDRHLSDTQTHAMEKKGCRHITMNFLCAYIFFISCAAVFPQATPTVKQAPPSGIDLPVETASELRSGLAALHDEIETIRKSLAAKPELQRMLPNIEIFHKAVRYAELCDTTK
jgi:hypothetical protein